MQHTFPTTGPVTLSVEIAAGDVTLDAIQSTDVSVRLSGAGADDITVEQRGDEVVIRGRDTIAGLFTARGDVRIDVWLPVGSNLATRLGSAQLVTTGRLGGARIKSGSGDVRIAELGADSVVETGSGDLAIEHAGGDLRVRSGSGDNEIGRVVGVLSVVAGSGLVRVGAAEGGAAVKSGSGDIELGQVQGEITAGSGSGTVAVEKMRRGVLRVTTASGDVSVGIPAGVPVWTDVRSATGDVESDLEGAGRPAAGQDHIEIHATTVTGNVRLSQLRVPART